MASLLSKILRFSTVLKVASLICFLGLFLAYLSPFIHPNTFKLLPFFGLAYPVILIVTLILLVIWLFAWNRWAVFTLLALGLGGKLHFRFLAVSSDPEVPADETHMLHVMSYNVRLFGLYDGDERERLATRDSIFSYVKGIQPDLICFQEFYHQDRPTKFKTRDSLISLLGITDYHERYAHKLNGRQNFGVAMLSKYKMIAKGDVMFETQGEKDFNYCIYADIVKGVDTFRVYNVHLQSIRLQQDDYSMFETGRTETKEKKSIIRLVLDKLRIAFPKRAEQARTVMEHVKTSPYPTLVCGDFNDTPLSYCYNQFNQSLQDAFRGSSFGIGSTYIGKVPAGRIDYIFHTEDLYSSNFVIQKQKLSDHRAISCKIIKKQPNP